MQKTLATSLFSILLVMTLLVQLLPAQVFATEVKQSTTIPSSALEQTDPALAEKEAKIVEELTDKRTASSKQYLLSNGLTLAVLYAEPVHFQKEGQWREIDNTLARSSSGYQNVAGQWQVSLPDKLGGEEAVSVTKDGHKLQFKLSGEIRLGSSRSAGKADSEVRIQPAQSATGQVEEIDITAAKAAAEYPETVSEKLRSRIRYESVYPGTDIIYDIKSNTLKESIVMAAYDQELHGYRYTLETGDLIPVLNEDGSVNLQTREGKTVLYMPAPYLVDNSGATSKDIEVALTGADGIYTLSYIPDAQWLSSQDRQWPVILDPVVTTEVDINNIKDITLYQRNAVPNYQGGVLECGYTGSFGISRAFIQYVDLPELTSSDVIISANLRMYRADTTSVSNVIEVHKVNQTWDNTTVTWETQPSINATIEDFAGAPTSGMFYNWEITSIVQDWYRIGNTGLAITAPQSVETGSSNVFTRFWSSDYSDYQVEEKPAVTIVFRNNNGLESYWDYSSASAGRAGTGYVNNYTGNLVWTHSDVGFGGNRMPVTISHVYNLNDVITPGDANNSNDSGGNTFGAGMGWRTNFNQLLYHWQLNGTDTGYYVWEDADGTDHYFAADSSGVLRDEDGLELTLTTGGSGTEKYCISDKYGNKSYFDTLGRLTKISNNQATKSSITISYTTASSKYISTVSDGAGRSYSFTYTNNLLTRISYKGSGSSVLSYVDFAYSGSLLTKITYKDGKYSSYAYNGQNLLISAQDIDGYKLSYTYNTVSASWQPYRVQSVAESHNGTAGGGVTFSYDHNQTTLTDHNGNKSILQFNDFGNLTSVQDDEGRAQFAQYTFNTDAEKASPANSTQKGNQMRISSDLHYTVANLMGDNNLRFSSVGWSVVNATKTLTTDRCYADLSALKVTTKATNSGVKSAGFTLAAGQTHTFSCYVASDAVSVYLQAESGGNVVKSQYQALDDEWYRLQVSYTNTSASSCTVYYSVRAVGVGTFYMDCAQLEAAPTSSQYNLINSGDFNYAFKANQWVASNLTSGEGITTVSASAAPQLDNHAVKIVGDPAKEKKVTQTVLLDGNPGDYLTLAGWAKGNSAALKDNRAFALQAVILYADGTVSDPFVAQFNPDSDQWQFAATPIFAEKDFWKIEVSLIYRNNVNTVYFDGIQLLKIGLGDALEYDSNGNVISVLSPDGREDTYQYTANNLTKEILSSGAQLTYTYDSYHNVKTATTEEGLVYNFTYDGYGNNTAVSITGAGSTMTATAAYTSDGNRLSSTRDAMGNTTAYGYNADTNVLEWVQYPEDTSATRTNYTYDSMYRMATAAATTDTGKAMSVSYAYSNDQLASVTTPTATYSFSYGSFGLASTVKVGTKTLASYRYTDDRNFYLSALDYGNGDKVQYTYDDKGRVLSATYEDGNTVKYAHDNSGTLATITDSASGTTAAYGYDHIGRLASYREKRSGVELTLGYSYYVSNKQLKTLREVINGHVRGASYIYDDDTRLTSYQKANGKRVYTYDGFDRVSGYTTTHKNSSGNFDTVLSTGFTFASSAVSTTSAQVSALQQSAPGHSVTYQYTYDGNGNILSVSDGSSTTTYVYDSANQLVRENNQAGGFTHVWIYDRGGNILSRTEYAYTTGILGAVQSTVSYHYGDSQWGDLLTGYGNRAVSHDAIGNTLSDGKRTYTWEHGRQLATLTQNGITWQNTYNAEGLRTQRTDGTNTYAYVYYDGLLQYMEYNGQAVYFTHAPDGTPMGMLTEGDAYFYITNLQGDVTGILDAEGELVVSYTYDAWGNQLSTTGSLAGTIGILNPIRYRGYVYDAETGLYYLQSRYYDPEIGRFINADAFASTGQGFTGNNMFAYCGNNPVTFEDAFGNMRKPCTVAINDGTQIGIKELLYVFDQTDSSVGNKALGLSSVSYSGCGAVATYNALVTLGVYTSFDSVLNYYNSKLFDLTALGAAGMLPHVVAGYFEDAGYHVVITDNLDGIDVFSKSADASILFYAAPCSYNIGGQLSVNSFYAHFVHYKQAKSVYLGYNTGGKEGYSWLSRPSDYANQNQSFYAVGIYIYR